MFLYYFYIFLGCSFSRNFGISNIFGFPAVYWAPKWTKTSKFGCVPFDSNFKLLKDFLNTVFVLFEDHYWSIFQHDPTIFEEVRAKVGKNDPLHGSGINTEN